MTASPDQPLWRELVGDTEPWRRGRIILVILGLFFFVQQSATFVSALLEGRVEQILIFAIAVVLFWLQFYFVWIGIHWIRWVWGAWNLIIGFCLLIWAWLDGSGPRSVIACVTLLIGVYLCFSPSVYFFAQHQRESVRWKEALLIGAVCLMMLVSIAAGMFGVAAFKEDKRRDAGRFAADVVQKVCVEHDREWILRHVTKDSLKKKGYGRLDYFLTDAKDRVSDIVGVHPHASALKFRFRWPVNLESEAHVTMKLETESGPYYFGQILLDSGRGWEIDRMSWDYFPPSRTPRKLREGP